MDLGLPNLGYGREYGRPTPRYDLPVHASMCPRVDNRFCLHGNLHFVGLDALTTRLRRGLTLCGRNKELKVQGEMCQLRNEIARLSNEVRSKESLITSGQAEKLPDAGVRVSTVLAQY